MFVTGVQQHRDQLRNTAHWRRQLYWRFFLPQVQKQAGLSQGDWIFLQDKKTGNRLRTRKHVHFSSFIPVHQGLNSTISPMLHSNTEEHNSRSVFPIWRGAAGNHPELILHHLACHCAKWWALSKELSINRARRTLPESLWMPLSETTGKLT